MGAIAIGQKGYITKAPPWSHRMFKMGRLGFEPGVLPPHLAPFLLRKGDVSGIVSECRAQGKARSELVKCIFTKVGIARRRGGARGT